MVEFIVYGEPQGKQRARTVRNKYSGKIHSYTLEETELYENLIKMIYKKECDNYSFGDKALKLNIVASYSIPKSTSQKKYKKMIDGEIVPTKKPDVDNIVKVVADALNKIAYKDDSQIASVTCSKVYSEKPSIFVSLEGC